MEISIQDTRMHLVGALIIIRPLFETIFRVLRAKHTVIGILLLYIRFDYMGAEYTVLGMKSTRSQFLLTKIPLSLQIHVVVKATTLIVKQVFIFLLLRNGCFNLSILSAGAVESSCFATTLLYYTPLKVTSVIVLCVIFGGLF